MISKHKLKIALLLAFFAVLATPCILLAQEPVQTLNGQRVSKQFVQAIKQGHMLQDQKKYVAALNEYKKALNFAPTNSDALSYCANTLSMMGKHQEAFKYFEILSKKEPTNEDILLNCAESLAKAGNSKDAIQFYDRVVKLTPTDSKSCYLLGNALLELHQPSEALRYFKKSAELNPENLSVQLACGKALLQLNKQYDAIVYFENMRSSSRGSEPLAWLLESGAYASLGDNEAAANTCDNYLQKFPENITVCSEMKKRAAILRKNRIDQAVLNRALATGSYLYEIEVDRWKLTGAPIAVFIKSGKQTKFWNEQYNQIVRQAFMAWQSNSGGLFRFTFVDREQVADIVCSWTGGSLGGNTTGRTSFSCPVKNEIKSAAIILLTSLNKKTTLGNNNIKKAALHEIGHALGIVGGHSSMDTDIMYYEYDFSTDSDGAPSLLKPSRRDIATLWQIYSWDPKNTKAKKIK